MSILMTVFDCGLQDGPKVLHDLDFQIKSGEHIGIGAYFRLVPVPGWFNTLFLVGRTGSGKVSYLGLAAEVFMLRIMTEFSDISTAAVYSYRRHGLLRRSTNLWTEPGCTEIKYYHHTSNRQSIPISMSECGADLLIA